MLDSMSMVNIPLDDDDDDDDDSSSLSSEYDDEELIDDDDEPVSSAEAPADTSPVASPATPSGELLGKCWCWC